MIRESVVENTIISLLQDQSYELFDVEDTRQAAVPTEPEAAQTLFGPRGAKG